MAAGEFDFIRNKLVPLTRNHSAALQLLDDAALLDVEPGHQLVLACDTLIESVHFLADSKAITIAQRALGTNLSDLAAMGAKPIGYLWALILPETCAKADELALAFQTVGERYNLPLLGGDTTRGGDRLIVTLTLIGSVPEGQALSRSGGKVGEKLWVSGHIGDAWLDLQAAKGTLPRTDGLPDRYENPAPRLEVGQALRGIASACIDISDGLVADAGHLAGSSNIALELEATAIPLSSAGKAWLSEQGAAGLLVLISAGDDYELLFTAPPSQTAAIHDIASKTGTLMTPIGRAMTGQGVTVLDAGGADITPEQGGFTHF